jgi:sterol desaturase/sphingolipid hydroxylase (fatty acid hydroxylase superfamily)
MSLASLSRRVLSLPTARATTTSLDGSRWQRAFAIGFHPVYLGLAIVACSVLRTRHLLPVFLGSVALLATLERLLPMRADFRPTVKDTLVDVFVFLLLTMYVWGPLSGSVMGEYMPAVRRFSRSFELAQIWPTEWPRAARVGLVWLLSDFIWYWVHRAEHEWKHAWQITGHMFHHAPKKTSAFTTFTNHPIELPIVAATVALPILLGARGSDVIYFNTLSTIQNMIVHCNIALRPMPIFALVFGTPQYHRRHHSVDKGENNSNYGCMLILYDRLFGTFVDEVKDYETGVGSRELTLVEKFLIPLRLPAWQKQEYAAAPPRARRRRPPVDAPPAPAPSTASSG